MKKTTNSPDIPPEYDLKGGVRGKYANRYAEGTNVVVVDADVARFFPDHDSVNDALRHSAAVIAGQRKPGGQPASGSPTWRHMDLFWSGKRRGGNEPE